MAIRVALHHETIYQYDREITISPQTIRLRPAPHTRTPVLSYSLRVLPKDHFLNWQQDPQSNYLARLVFPNRAERLKIEVDLVAELTVINPFDFFLESYAETFPFAYEAGLTHELAPYLLTEPLGPRLGELLSHIDRRPTRVVDFLVELNRQVHQAVSYVIRLEPGIQSCEETLALGSGSCRDSAWLLVQLLRSLGLAARFVSGYLIQLTPDVKPLEGPAGTDRDFTDLHAWTEVYLPGAGWVGLDPTSGLLAGEGHIPLACTPDPASAAPLSGSVEISQCDFSYSLSVRRIHEDPRVTKPYTDKQWQAIDALGHQVDSDFERLNVRLTMGGEPTFVSIDDMEGDEWNIDAVGPTKRKLADNLLRRLHKRFAPGGLLHYGQGKWYPGESLPRWALSCYWRRDGQPIWEDPDLFAAEGADYGHDTSQAQEFVTALAERLRLDPSFVLPAYEDAWHYLWRERRLPANVDPLKSNLDDPEKRARLARVFEQGLNKVVGYTLPLQPCSNEAGPRWSTGHWFFRPETMYLIPGDSPMGFRLPLDSLPWTAPDELAQYQYEFLTEVDPTSPRGPLPDRSQGYEPHGGNGWHGSRQAPRHQRVLQQAGGGGESGEGSSPEYSDQPLPTPGATLQAGISAQGIVRTALCVEPRQGRLHVFMPPTRHIEDYLHLAQTVEATASELGMPVVIEGYLPPHDDRVNHIKVTPDPGVIEVNVHPAHSWDELKRITSGLYDDARQARLGTEKFMVDGRHTGTGGGNHIVVGGRTPAESPLLRRPDLLKSLLSYWHNHPSLSYLFSGLFVGPTSQAPRTDEGRHDSVYELEIAHRQIDAAGTCPPWLVDRVYRHLLTDLTGNTHRVEFCIDKLYSPDSASGRLGLVEFRGFEMPPHPRMSLTQQLLLRALIARFWKQPYEARLVRWGTELHDRFLLPHFVAQDFDDVLVELQRAGYGLQWDWFLPHLEFRFPALGRVAQRGIELELRQAIEPWHVLGEEQHGGGTSRYVDSSLERMQVLVRGMTDTRHTVTCNGHRLPLHPTGTNGEFVAGVRYRAWQPPSCLHPTIPVHTPLVFDIVDQWMHRSLGGCTYHVSHPGGLSYETFPVNSYEAESRRAARFFDIGHTGGELHIPPEARNPDFPLTLDLRRG